MGTLRLRRPRLASALALGISAGFAGCAHSPEQASIVEPDDPAAGLRRDNASLRRRVQMLEDRVLKLERGVPGSAAHAERARAKPVHKETGVQRLPDGRELPVYTLDPDDPDTAQIPETEAPGGPLTLPQNGSAELDDESLWADHSGFATEEESSQRYRLVGQNLVRLTEPGKPKAPDREPTGRRGRTLKAQYASALELYRAAAYAEAEAAFDEIAREYPRSDYADNAYYWMGEAAYDQAHFSDALAAFTAVVERYGGGNKAPDALLKIGLCYEKLGDDANARDVLSQLVTAYPRERASDIARSRLAELPS